ncbi:BTB and MATH domain-containing protein 40 [Symbiodinium microadriaticum]|uniref:BTB and MATH domain-containing protein 40 n=1 Tax=Symbiodinium microadriaticum TaxID=2951 RepID=A0A1Q9DFN3_SYMMI|nr:BTB and MATH domain-containing protein 40 [Symbiodinium microadriaticum]
MTEQEHPEELRLVARNLTTLPDLRGLSHVTILDASDNRLVSVARLSAQMPALRRLRLARNRLRRVERLGDLPKLQLLDVSENLLGPTPGAALHMIGNCSELRAIFVAGNPFVEIAEDLRAYRYQLLDLVPSLRFIDGEAVGKARPGVELSTAPEAFELHTKYYHPTESVMQWMVKWPTSPLPVTGSHTFGTGGAAATYAFAEKRRTTSLPRAGRLARSASEGALVTKRPKAALSPTLPKSLCRSASAAALREKTWPRVFLLESEILRQFSTLCDFCRRPQATLEELLPLYAWLVASLQDSRGFSTSFNDATAASFHMPALRLLRWSSSRCRQMSHMCTLSNKALAADVLHSCFGQGDFKVVVEEVLEDGTKRTEFPVWSLLLRKWSDVFANMMSHQQFIEGSNAEVVIKDFSACAVDAFLRFLYSGTLSANLSTLIEVGVIADKYQVQPLYKACMGTVKEKLASETACEIFECADRFHLEELRRKAKEEILIEPRDALPRRSSLSSKLLDEVLSSELLCIEEWELLELFLEWGSAEDLDAVLQLIAKHVDLRGIPEDDFQQLCADSRTRGQKAVLLRMREKQPQEQRFKRSQHCTDMLSALYLRHIEEGHERLPFLGYWVNVIPGDLSQEWLNSGIEHMQHIARNGSFLNLEDGWIVWTGTLPWFQKVGYRQNVYPLSICLSLRQLVGGDVLANDADDQATDTWQLRGQRAAVITGEKADMFRVQGRLLTQSLNFELLLDPSLADSWRRIFPREFLVAGMTHTVRTLRFEAEIRAGLWVRNGESMRAQHVDYRTKTRQTDIMTLQAFMILLRMHGSEDAACEPPAFLWTAVFDDANVAEASSVRIAWQRLWVQSVSEQTRTRFRLFWLLLCQVLNEMFPIEVAMCRRAWEPRYSYRCPVILQRFLIQVLASGPMSLSELANLLPKELQVRESQLAQAVEAVASTRVGQAEGDAALANTGKRTYVLKQRSWQHFDICTAEAMPIRNLRDGTWRERQHRAEEKALAQQALKCGKVADSEAMSGAVAKAVLLLWAMASSETCPKPGHFQACQTDVELGQGVASKLPPRPAASCSAHGLCAEAGLTSGDCCPTAGDGIYLKCCDAQAGSRRLSPLHMGKKGVTIDDTTLQWCAGRIPQIWPNLQDTPVGSLRIFQTWSTQWHSEGRRAAWTDLVDYAKANGIKILVGTPVTCIEADDDTAWSWTKELVSMLGTEHVMGLAVGNELELLYQNADSECIQQLWSGGRLWKTFQSRVTEFDNMGFSSVPVTSVFTASVLTGSAVVPFTEKPSEALVNTFLRNAVRKYGKRYAFTFNVYPYFDPNIHLNPGTVDKCNLDLPRVICWDKPTCLGPNIMASARKQMHYLTNRWDDLFWIGEIGWSSPKSSNLGTKMADCPQFSSLNTFQTFYNGFLEWDLTLPGGVPAPDHIFYFTLRDSLNFGKQEHFGLLTSCYSLGCKIATPSFRPQSCALPELKKPPSWQVWGFAILGVLLAFCVGITCLYVRSPTVKRFIHGDPKESSRRRLQAPPIAAEESDSSSE